MLFFFPPFDDTLHTQVNRMSKSRSVLATRGKQRSFGLHMVCFEMVLYHNEPHSGIKSTYKPKVYRMTRILKAMHVFELNLFEFKSHLNSEMW